MSKWCEVRVDFYNEEEKKWLVDAWKTPDDNEEGSVIAKIDGDGNVEYLDEDAKTDPYAQEEIRAKVKELKGMDGGYAVPAGGAGKAIKARYELFKLEWMMQHGYTVSDLVDSVLQYRSELAEEMTDDPDGLDVLDCNLFSQWEEECGFGGNIWPCEEEFIWEDDSAIARGTNLYKDHALFLRIVQEKQKQKED